MAELLEVRQVSRRFYKGRSLVTAVNGVSFSLGRGEVLGIVGESGSGKTTLIKMVTRLLEADEGEILLEGEDITRAVGARLRKARRQMQLVFQTPQDSFDQTAYILFYRGGCVFHSNFIQMNILYPCISCALPQIVPSLCSDRSKKSNSVCHRWVYLSTLCNIDVAYRNFLAIYHILPAFNIAGKV